MNIKEPEKQYFDDYEHKVTGRINLYGDQEGFPKFADYHVTKEELDDYLFDKQAILDSEGSQRSQLTVGGIIIVIPVLILSAFPYEAYPWGVTWTTLAALLLGVVVALFVKSLMKMIIYMRLNKMKNRKLESYIHAVLSYQPRM